MRSAAPEKPRRRAGEPESRVPLIDLKHYSEFRRIGRCERLRSDVVMQRAVETSVRPYTTSELPSVNFAEQIRGESD
jgi:hypothetical protein